MELDTIQEKIIELRGQKVILDFNLAELYEVATKVLNQAVKRNIDRFPSEFMFQLTLEELQYIRKQGYAKRWSQFVTTSQKFRYVPPFAFTEHGVAMLASVLKSKKAILMNIAIVKAFISLRRQLIETKELADQIQKIRLTVSNHSDQLNLIYEAIEQLLDQRAKQKNWEDRDRIGYRK